MSIVPFGKNTLSAPPAGFNTPSSLTDGVARDALIGATAFAALKVTWNCGKMAWNSSKTVSQTPPPKVNDAAHQLEEEAKAGDPPPPSITDESKLPLHPERNDVIHLPQAGANADDPPPPPAADAAARQLQAEANADASPPPPAADAAARQLQEEASADAAARQLQEEANADASPPPSITDESEPPLHPEGNDVVHLPQAGANADSLPRQEHVSTELQGPPPVRIRSLVDIKAELAKVSKEKETLKNIRNRTEEENTQLKAARKTKRDLQAELERVTKAGKQ